MSDTEMIPKYRFDEVNEKRRDLEQRIKDLEAASKNMVAKADYDAAVAKIREVEAQAAVAETLSADVQTQKDALKALKEEHAATLKRRDQHDSLRDLMGDHPHLKDEKVRNLFLSNMPEGVEDPAEFVRSLTAEDAEVPVILGAFLSQASGDGGGAGGEGGQQTFQRPGPDPMNQGRKPRTSPTAFNSDQINAMTPDEYKASRAAIYQQAGIPAPPDASAGTSK